MGTVLVSRDNADRVLVAKGELRISPNIAAIRKNPYANRKQSLTQPFTLILTL